MSSLEDIQTQLDQTSGVIEGFRNSVAEGSVIDLTGLDQRIKAICTAIDELPAKKRIPLKAILISLIDALNGLVEMLHIQQLKASEGLKGVASRQQAVSAYGKGIKASKPGKPGQN